MVLRLGFITHLTLAHCFLSSNIKAFLFLLFISLLQSQPSFFKLIFYVLFSLLYLHLRLYEHLLVLHLVLLRDVYSVAFDSLHLLTLHFALFLQDIALLLVMPFKNDLQQLLFEVSLVFGQIVPLFIGLLSSLALFLPLPIPVYGELNRTVMDRSISRSLHIRQS